MAVSAYKAVLRFKFNIIHKALRIYLNIPSYFATKKLLEAAKHNPSL